MTDYSKRFEEAKKNFEEAKLKDAFYNMYQRRSDELKKPEVNPNQLPENVMLREKQQNVIQQEKQLEKFQRKVKNTFSLLSSVDISTFEKYARYAKITARVIDILADAAIAIIEGLSKNGNTDYIGPAEHESQRPPNSEIDISNLLRAAEKFINVLSK